MFKQPAQQDEARKGSLSNVGQIACGPFHQKDIAVRSQARHRISRTEEKQNVARFKAHFTQARP